MERTESQGFFLVKYGKSETAFKLQNVSLNAPGEGEVLIEVEAFGLNYADVMARNNLYKEAPPLPAILGYEVVGYVRQVGKNVSPELNGKRVVAFTRFGGYAKHALTPASGVAEIGEMPAEEALALSTQFVTAYYMTHYLSPLYAGEKVLIHAAAGGVGTALIQLCKWKKAFVYAKIGSDSKAALVKSLGADVVVNYNEDDYETQVQSHLKHGKLDVTYNPVGGSTFKKDMQLLGAGGKLIMFGGSERSGKKWGILSTLNFVRKMGFVVPVFLMMKSKSILGVNMLKVADEKPDVLSECLQQVVELTKQGILKPQVGATFASGELAKAHDLLASGKSTGKISVFWK